MTVDSKHEITYTFWTADGVQQVDVCFSSKEVENDVASVLNSRGVRRGRLVIAKVKSDGSFQGEIRA